MFLQFVEAAVEEAGDGGFVGGEGLEAAIVNGELLEIGEDAEGEFHRPRIAAELKGGLGIVLEGDGGLLGLDEKLAVAADAEGVVGSLGLAADFEGVLVDDLLVGFGVALGVGDIPTEGGEERVDELLANLGLFEFRGGVVGFVGGEGFDEGGDCSGQGHGMGKVVKRAKRGRNAGFGESVAFRTRTGRR